MAHGADGPADAGPVTVRGTDGAAGGLSPELGAVALAREQKCQQTVSGSESDSFALAREKVAAVAVCITNYQIGQIHLHLSLAKSVAAAHFKAKMIKCEPINSWPPSVHPLSDSFLSSLS